MLNPIDDATRVRELAESLALLTEDDFALLAGVKQSTVEAWRKRGTGPSYVLLGKRYFYLRAVVAAYIASIVRSRVDVARGAL